MGVFGFVAEILVFGGLVLGGRFSQRRNCVRREQVSIVRMPRNSNDLI
jgi:hypothetical protein